MIPGPKCINVNLQQVHAQQPCPACGMEDRKQPVVTGHSQRMSIGTDMFSYIVMPCC